MTDQPHSSSRGVHNTLHIMNAQAQQLGYPKFKDPVHAAYTGPKSTGVSAKKHIKRTSSHYKKDEPSNFKEFVSKNSARGEAYNFSDQQFARNQKFMGGSYFRNTKSQKKKAPKQQLYLGMQQQAHPGTMSLQQLQLVGGGSHHSSQQLFQTLNPQGLPPTNPSSGKLPMSLASTSRQIPEVDQASNMNLYQTLQQRQNSQQSLSQVSKGSQEQQSKEQQRRRMVALAQAQQQQILAAATSRYNSRDANQGNDQIIRMDFGRRNSGDTPDNQASMHIVDATNLNQNYEKARMNLTQPLSLNQHTNPNQITAHSSNVTNRNLATQVIFNNSQMLAGQKPGQVSGEMTSHHSPAKQGLTNAEGAPIKSARQVVTYDEISQRNKVQRHISGHTQRRLNQNQPNQKQISGYSASNIAQQITDHSSQDERMNNQQMTNNRRRQVVNEKDYDGDSNQVPIGLQYVQTHNSAQRTNHAQSLVKTQKSGDARKFQGAIMNNSQKTLRTLQPHTLDAQVHDFKEMSGSQTYLQPAQGLELSVPSNKVIYHPHPLNKNVPALSQMQMNIITKQQYASQNNLHPDSTRALSQRQSQGQMNNRVSRKNLKPIGKKKGPQTNQLHLNLMFKNSKKSQPFASAKQVINPQSIIPQLHLAHADHSASDSRERNIVESNYNTNPNQFKPINTSSNLTSKNMQFKFKSTAQGIKPGHVQMMDTVSHGSSGRRPIVVRQNNYVQQQQNYYSGGPGRSKEQHSQINVAMKHNTNSTDYRSTQVQPKEQIGKMKFAQTMDLTNKEASDTGLSGIAGLSAIESAFEKSRSDQIGGNQHLDQSKSINGPIGNMNETGEMVDGDSFKNVPALTARQSKEFKLLQQLGQSDQPSNSSHVKLIKVNKQKQKLIDTARRSQFQPPDTGNYHTIANDGSTNEDVVSRNHENQGAASINIASKYGKNVIKSNNNTVNVEKQSKSDNLLNQNEYNSEATKTQISNKKEHLATQSTGKNGARDMKAVKVKLCTQVVTRENSIETGGNKLESANTTTLQFSNKLAMQNSESNKTQPSMQKSGANSGTLPSQMAVSSSRGQQSLVQSFKGQKPVPKVISASSKDSKQIKTLKKDEILKGQKVPTEKIKIKTENSGQASMKQIQVLQEIIETKSQESNPNENQSVSLLPNETGHPSQLQNQISEHRGTEKESHSLGSKGLISAQKNQMQSEMTSAQPMSGTSEAGVNKNSMLNPVSEGDGSAAAEVTEGSKIKEKAKCETTMAKTKQLNTSFKMNQKTQASKLESENLAPGMFTSEFSQNSIASRKEVPPLPTSPQNILKFYIDKLTDYEKGEVLDYEVVYFLGLSKKEKVDANIKDFKEPQDDSKSSLEDQGKEPKEPVYNHNYGYDDDKGDYKIVTGDHIGFRYEIVEFLGKGSFGTALRCIDHKEKKQVAVKIVKNKKKYYYQASVELKILQYLKQHDVDDIMNVIHIDDYVIFRKHLCMAFELLSMNLFEFLKINDFSGFDHNLIRRFAIQLLYALKYLKQLEIIHCDLKPENILLKEENKSGIKIIDFGSSTFIDEKVYTYIQSRFYRAPEIMLGIPYTTAIDMWSLGCIMAELYIGYPIFPGESENDQMSRIMEMRDVPPPEVLEVSERKMKFFTLDKEKKKLDPIMLENSRGKLRKPNGKPLDYVIGDEDPDFNDFVIKCLDWNPETRLTPDDALKHVWVLKGLPPQVLIHHQKMHNIATPELPETVKVARNEFLMEQQREQMLLIQQQHRTPNAQRGQKTTDGKAREISQNPVIGRPAIELKTPKSASKAQPKLKNVKEELTVDP